MPSLTEDLAAGFARIALGHVTREYPHKLDHVLAGDEDARTPRDLHPIFFGSFDWHSCVHGYWLLARCLRRYPEMAPAGEVRALLDAMLTTDKGEAERAYLDGPHTRGFERPYGWAWALMLQAELEQHDAPWADAMRPMALAFVERFKAFLPLQTYPIRAGTHANSAFALSLTRIYAAGSGDVALAELLEARARDWFGVDRDCQAWEPSGDDFLSSALMEAECLRRVLAPAEFAGWFAAFLPRLTHGYPASLFTPATVTDRSDGKLAHLDGVNLSRAWCWRGIAAAHPEGDPVRAAATDAADRHLAAALDRVAGDYMGEHWLATFALLALDEAGT